MALPSAEDHQFYMNVNRTEPDVANLYEHAETVGLRVRHKAVLCDDFENLLEPGTYVRWIGGVLFDKKDRVWTAIPNGDCSATELSAVLLFGIKMVAKFGDSPRYGLRGRHWDHYIGKGTGHPLARCCISIPVTDEEHRASESIWVPDHLGEVSGLLESFRSEVPA